MEDEIYQLLHDNTFGVQVTRHVAGSILRNELSRELVFKFELHDTFDPKNNAHWEYLYHEIDSTSDPKYKSILKVFSILNQPNQLFDQEAYEYIVEWSVSIGLEIECVNFLVYESLKKDLMNMDR